MISGQFDMQYLAWLLNAAALAFGAVLGVRAVLDPAWAAKLVRLKADEARPGGFAEFRATYGGVFAASHVMAFLLSAHWILSGSFISGAYGAGAALVLGAAWLGSAAGRSLSMLRDQTATGFNKASTLIETATGLCIIAPWAVWTVSLPA